MTVFDGLVGQAHVREQLLRAAFAARAEVTRAESETRHGTVASVESSGSGANHAPVHRDDDSAMAQAWLVTGPPGSGRSVAARMFAAALECTGEQVGCGQCQGCVTTMEGAHPDVEVIATDTSVLRVGDVRDLVSYATTPPGSGAWRIIIIEDADRMLERTTNALLKAIEEPAPYVVWILCTPSAEDVLPTIRSRCRHVSLSVPRASEVADLLVSEGVDPQVALTAAHASQAHVGRARGLATDPEAARERRFLLDQALAIRSAADAVVAAHRIVAYYPGALDEPAGSRGAGKNPTDARLEEAFAEEKELLRRQLGVDPAAKRLPPAVASQFRALEEEQKRRRTRQVKDRVDRVLLDIISAYRDVLTIQLDAGVSLVNSDVEDVLRSIASASTVSQTIARMDALAEARTRIAGNVAPKLAIEAALMTLRNERGSR